MALNTEHAIMFSIATMSIIVQFMIILSIHLNKRKWRMLRGSFFKLITCQFVADLLYYFEFNIFMRGRKYGYLSIDEDSIWLLILPRVTTAFHYYIKIVVYVGQLYFAANRFTSAAYPMDYERIWGNSRLAVLFLIQWTIPLAAVLPINLNFDFQIVYIPDKEADTLRLVNDDVSTEWISYIDLGCSTLSTIACLFVYLSVLIVVRSSSATSFQSKADAARELRLLLASFIMFLVFFLNSGIQIGILVSVAYGIDNVLVAHDFSYPLNDALYSSQPWALLLSSTLVRESVAHTFIPWEPKTKITSQATMVTPTITHTHRSSR